MSRKVHLGIRYVPEFLQYHPNPMQELLNMTRNMKYRVIEKNAPKHKVTKVLLRCISMAERGWYSTGPMRQLGVLSRYQFGLLRELADLEFQKISNYLSFRLPVRVYDKVIDKMVDDSESSSEDDRRSVNKEDSDDDSLDER